MPNFQPIPVVVSLSAEEIKLHITSSRVPVIFRGCDIGPCVVKWTTEYLKTIQPDKNVKVHKSLFEKLDFRKKNFTYETISFEELINYCSQTEQLNFVSQISSSCTTKEHLEEYCLPPDSEETTRYFWYLRSLGVDPRGKDISDISVHFPELYADLKIPPIFDEESFFSSVFRITSPKLQLWTHYDTCDNILIQIRGRKRIIFFPPSEALNLYLDGDKSEVLDVDNPDTNAYPKFNKAKRYEALLEEGDIVYIPALWFHNVTALNFSVSVNVFWKNLSQELYDKKDTYGNRDLIPAQLGFRTLEKAAAQLKNLPKEYEDLYLRRMIVYLEKRLLPTPAVSGNSSSSDAE